MTLVQHAETELRLAGFYDATDEDADFNALLLRDLLPAVKLIADQGHSGGSIGPFMQILQKLVKYDILTPLTGEEDEWTEVSARGGIVCFRNKRYSSIFMDMPSLPGETEIYDTRGKVFVDPDGLSFTTQPRSRVPVTFPYTPKTTYVDVDDEGEELAGETDEET